MIQTIVFDIGNVLIDFHPMPYVRRLLGDEATADRVTPLVFRSDEWLMLDRGTISQDEAAARIAGRNPELAQAIHTVFDNWMPLMTPIEPTVELLSRLKGAGYRLYYLSNFHVLAFAWLLERRPFFRQFDGGVVSYEVHSLKPEPEIYQELLRRYDLQAEHCLFLDDMHDNVDTARTLGMQAIQVTDFEALPAQLAAEGVVL